MSTVQEREAEVLGRLAAKEGKGQNDNPYNPKRRGEPYNEHLATVWNHAFCNEAFGTVVFD